VTEKGLTLLETMVALVILGIVVVGYLELFGATVRTSRSTAEWTQAVTYAEQGMESAKLDLESALLGGRDTLAGGFRRRFAARTWSGGLQLVTVTVSLPDGGAFTLSRLFEAP
jgi:prepilin-type N-terminal cleavage/methylation domain-containing protein